MATNSTQKQAARQFVKDWTGRGSEKSETSKFWISLLQNVFGIQEQKSRIEQTAQGILDARALFPDSNLADLYDELTMPPELRKAHRANDTAVLEAYGFPKNASESDIVARLFIMYQDLTK